MYKLFTFLLVIIFTTTVAQKKQISLEDIWKTNTFRQEGVAGFRSMNDGKHYSEINDQGQLQKVRFADGKVESIIANFKTLVYENESLKIDDYEFNADETKLILQTQSEAIYRHSILHKIYIYDIASKEIKLLNEQKVLHASFSPKSDKVAYVLDNNLYYLDITNNQTEQVTFDGEYNIINGNCDWVYEEEFGFTKAFEWSKDGDYIAYYHFNQTAVPEFNFTIYDKLYPTDYKFKYPKAGEKNSIVDINIYHLANKKTTPCDLGDNKDIYIPRIKINPTNNALVIFKLNRLQNKFEILEANIDNGNTKVIYEESNKYYVAINDDIQFLNNKNGFIYTSEKNGFNHIYVHDIDNNSSFQITKGNWDVAEIYGVDEAKNTIYYLSAEKSPMERNVYSIEMNGENKILLTPYKGWHTAEFSKGFEYFMEKYSYINTPPTYGIHNKKGELVRMLKDNAALVSKMKEYDLSKLELIQVPNNEGTLLNGWIIKPSNFSSSKKYPLLMFQYSGPGSQQVMNSFGGRDFWWYQMLAQKGYIIVCVDGTGTGFRGEEFKKKTYLQLGKYESDDQIAVAKYFAKQKYIDASRIGIWGWSFGGYMSSICILKGADVFKTAIAVAPVTNWRYYDNIYTERYMQTPQTNAKGYDENSPVNMVNNLKGNYLIIHGTADDNVHFQNAVMMVDELIKANKDFDSEYYPNKNHGIGGGNTRLQLYRKLTHFILEKL
jgi:dipeptidyl-peptidase-4